MQRRMKRDQVVVLKILDMVKEHLDDPLETNRLLRELGKFYDPVIGAAMVDGATRKRLVDLLERGERDEVAAAIDGYIEAYTAQLPETARPDQAGRPPGAAEGGPGKPEGSGRGR